MKKIIKVLRLFFLVVLLIAGAFGLGITGNFLSGNRERYLHNEIRSEQVDKKEDEADEEVE